MVNAILRALPDLVFVLGHDYTFTDAYFSDPSQLLLPRDQFIGRSLGEVLPTDIARQAEGCVDRARAGDGVQELAYALEIGGSRRHYEARLSAAEDGAVVVHSRDVTDRHQAEQALRESEARFALFMDRLPGLAWLKNPDGQYVYVNEGFGRSLNLEASAICGHTDHDLFDPDAASEFEASDERVLTTQEELQVVQQVQHAERGRRDVLVTKFPVLAPDGVTAFVGGFAIDITDLRQAQETLRKAHAFQQSLIEAAAEGICVCAAVDRPPGLVFSLWNERMTEITGYTMAEVNELGWHATMYPNPEDAARAMARVVRMRDGDHLRNEEWTVTRRDGAERVLAISTSSVELDSGDVATVALMQDVTDRKRAEEALRQTQKLESLGLLAGGVAHDFNNLLTSMLGFSALALADLPRDSPSRPMIEEAERAAARAAELTTQLLAYAGRATVAIGTFRLDTLARETSQLLAAVVGRAGRLRLMLEPAAVRADQTQVRQLMMNLITNAADALAEDGLVTIRTGVVVASREMLASPYLSTSLPDGPYAFIEVEDDGIGMDAEAMSRVFDPFFSTKGAGRGLGLAAALGIIRSHNGTVTVKSAPGAGTTMRVGFPSVELPAEVAASVDRGSVALRPEQTGHVLVVDDDEAVRRFTKEALVRAGFDVTTARSGREALRVVADGSHRIRAMVIDLKMPEMDGATLVRRLRNTSVNAPVLVLSAFPAEEIVERFAGLDIAGIAQKPIRPSLLVDRVRAMIDGDDKFAGNSLGFPTD